MRHYAQSHRSLQPSDGGRLNEPRIWPSAVPLCGRTQLIPGVSRLVRKTPVHRRLSAIDGSLPVDEFAKEDRHEPTLQQDYALMDVDDPSHASTLRRHLYKGAATRFPVQQCQRAWLTSSNLCGALLLAGPLFLRRRGGRKKSVFLRVVY